MRRADGATEDQEQIALFRWAAYQEGRFPELRCMFHVANGGYRTPIEAARFKAMGVKAGVPDIFLPVARSGYHGLFIELKRANGGRLSDAQRGWLEALRRCGYYAVMCHGWETARDVITDYLAGGGEIGERIR